VCRRDIGQALILFLCANYVENWPPRAFQPAPQKHEMLEIALAWK
jgi:hypothetical protein